MMQRSAVVLLLFMVASVAHLRADDHGLVDLFNGKNLCGWTQRNGTATYRVEDNAIVGKASEGSPNSFLCSDKLFGDFELKFEAKVDRALNSGVQIRSQSIDDKPDGRVNGPQVEISLDGMAGYVYGEAAGGWMTPDADRKPHQHFKDGEWNRMVITCIGSHLQVELNGEQIVDTQLDKGAMKDRPLEGYIGFQDHGQPNNIKFRDIRIREIKP